MLRLPRASHGGPGLAAFLLLCSPSGAAAQGAPRHGTRPDSVEITAGVRYQTSGLHQFLFGTGYRDLWATPMRVEVLDLGSFAGGLRATKVGGGVQTKSLHFVTPDGVEYSFRSVDKDGTLTPKGFKGTVVQSVLRDQVGASDPAAALVAARLLHAAGVLQAAPVLLVMPDDPRLGEFREAFAGRLGLMEESPGTPEHRAGFAGAVAIVDSDTLLAMLDRDPDERIDAPALLTARLMDMLIGDWDRHQGQWKWARMRSNPRSPWVPIPRDRDKAFVSYGGLIPGLARLAAPNLMSFRGSYASVRGLTWNSVELDRRLLGGLAKPVWDSVAATLVRRMTDAVIDDAVLALPAEHRGSAPALAATLKLRRDALPGAAERFYLMVAAVADIHATDAADRATVTRVDDRVVEVRLASGNTTPYFLRRFDVLETSEIRIHLHGGADTALITGQVEHSILVRIIGGNGANRLTDSSRVGGSGGRARLYDTGTVRGITYGLDTLFNRRPWVREHGELVPPGRDRGGRFGPIIGVKVNRELGIVPHLGVARVRYGFDRRPYASRVALDAEYATTVGGFRIGVSADQRLEGTPVHLLANARMSDLEILSFHGLGNATPDSANFFEVRQRQWRMHPAIALALGSWTDLSLGPEVQFSVADSTPNRFLSATRPYGFGSFGQALVRLSLHHDTRDDPADPHRGLLADFSGSVVPAVWDVTSPFEVIAGSAAAWFTLPVPVHPILVLRGGAKKVFGTFPFHEAAFIGGRSSLRSLDAQRFGGDAALYGTAELRVPVAKFAFILPWNVGIFGVVDAGRVYVNGASPGGWHRASGVGFWIGVLNPPSGIRVCRRPGRSGRC